MAAACPSGAPFPGRIVLRAAIGAAAELHTQHREKLVDIHGLRDVVRRAGLEALLAIALHRLRGDGDQRKIAKSGTPRISRIVS